MTDVEQLVYEQCPYDWRHVSQLYRSLPREPEEAEGWIALSSRAEGAVRYRRRGGYFQFVVGRESTSLFREVLRLEPMDTEDDAEWTLEKHGAGAYLVRSKFATTFGPLHETQRLDLLLRPFGLWLENRGTHVSGAATFGALNPRELLLACRRLLVLEDWCVYINGEAKKYLGGYWDAVRSQVEDRIAAQGQGAFVVDSRGGKRRLPVPEVLAGCPDLLTADDSNREEATE